MSVTDLTEARWTLSHLEEAGCPLETTDMRGYWRGRVAELEAAEKEGQASDEPETEPVLDRLAALERRFENHAHNYGNSAVGRSSLPLYP